MKSGLIVDSKTYDEVNDVISQEIKLKPDTFLTPNMLECFFEKLEKQSGIIISDEMKDRIKESKEKLKFFKGKGELVARDINENGEKVTVFDSKYDIALRNICKEIADYCLYPKKQEVIMDEWISKYKEIENSAEQVTADTRNEQLNELANMLPLEIFKNEELLQIFWSKIDDSGIKISENEKKLMVNLMNDVEQNAPNSKELKGFINEHCSSEEQFYSKILSKNLESPEERADLNKAISNYCLYQINQENTIAEWCKGFVESIMDEWTSKYKKIENGVEQVTADTRNEQLNELDNMLPLEILKNEELLQILWSKIDDAGIKISESEKKLIVNLMNDVEQNAPNSKELKGFINEHCSSEEQIYSKILFKNLEPPEERADLDEAISNYCLYQINQENMISDWCKGYVELEKTLEQCSKEERITRLNELSSKFPTKIFKYQDEELVQNFWNAIKNIGIDLKEEDKELIQGIVNDIPVDTNDEMSIFMGGCVGYGNSGQTASRVLCKNLQDDVILKKGMSEITYSEGQYIFERLYSCNIQREDYRVQIEDDQPYVQITKRDSIEPISQRIKDTPYFIAKNMSKYKTSFLTIQESESIGEYINRMSECVSLIDRYIRGEDIEFNEYGQSIETTREATQAEQSRQNLLESAIEATIDAKITAEEKDTARKTIISIENARQHDNTIDQNNGEISN